VGPIALDADVIIGFLDPADAQHEKAVETLGPLLMAGNPLVIAASVYAEVLVQPMRVGLDQRVDAFLAESSIEVVPIDRLIARRAASIRAKHHSLRLPDALALATAIERNAGFVSLDERLQRIADTGQ
jgi:predicted nucleic acid-binding protein